MMSHYEEVAFIAMVGEPIVEVAAVVTRRGNVVNKFHEFVNYFNVNFEGNRVEMEPVTDSFGTRFMHGIGEMELECAGLPLPIVQERLRLFLSIFGPKLKVIVNENHTNCETIQYREMKQSIESVDVWCMYMSCYSNQWLQEKLKQTLQITQCTGHHSGYYQSKFEPVCALRVAYIMAMMEYKI